MGEIVEGEIGRWSGFVRASLSMIGELLMSLWILAEGLLQGAAMQLT
jgi:hypothetical protein